MQWLLCPRHCCVFMVKHLIIIIIVQDFSLPCQNTYKYYKKIRFWILSWAACIFWLNVQTKWLKYKRNSNLSNYLIGTYWMPRPLTPPYVFVCVMSMDSNVPYYLRISSFVWMYIPSHLWAVFSDVKIVTLCFYAQVLAIIYKAVLNIQI